MKKLIECVPNFSEGRDLAVIKKITASMEAVEGVKLLDVDPGKDTNRTVVTIVGEPEAVIEAAFYGIKTASELIDMSKHTGEHPRMGATDVCPLIPISNISMEETAEYAHKLAKRVGEKLNIPIYMYESAATSAERKNLATVRAGEYEGLEKKLADPQWKPDYGPTQHHVGAGATAIGARDFLIAYNVNLNTESVKRANSVAFDIREKGRIKRLRNPVTGTIVLDAQGNPERTMGSCKGVKAIGWYIEEYGQAQISMNITDINQTKLHEAFEACRESATRRGLRVTGSELVGLVPKKVMLETGKYYLNQQDRSSGVSEKTLIHIAAKSLGLDEITPFDPDKKVIEYLLESKEDAPLANMTLIEFADETASDSPAPGGGSISANVGALGVALATMVANLSAAKRGWEDKLDLFSAWAEKGQSIKDKLLHLIDQDTSAFNKILDAVRMPKVTDDEKKARANAMIEATKYAISVPMDIMKTSYSSYDLLEEMSKKGNPNSISDVGVGAACVHTAIYGAYLNVLINCKDLNDKTYVDQISTEAKEILDQSLSKSSNIANQVLSVITGEK